VSVPGLRVVLDARPLQDPERAPATAVYLEGLLGAFDAEPLPGESFAFLLASDLDDPTARFTHLDVVGRRLLPPIRLLRSGALIVDPFLLRGASLGAAWRAGRSGAAGAVYHASSGSIPLASGLPVVVTLLDLAPWELPQAFQRGATARFGQRLRARLLREAGAVIVASQWTARAVRRLLRLRSERIRVVSLAAREVFHPEAVGADGAASERRRLGLPDRYFVYSGRYDARQDLRGLLTALAELAREGRPGELPESAPWPPRVLLVGASPDDRAALARAAAREGVGELVMYAPRLDPARLAALVAGARAAVMPAISDAAGLTAVEAIAAGIPVIATAVGALPEIVGSAGILVEPRDPSRLAAALAAAWADDLVYERLRVAVRERLAMPRRRWLDVARETREVYADVGIRPASGSAADGESAAESSRPGT
jgi:glycosyltransferase involved in cell wall biosynthesis